MKIQKDVKWQALVLILLGSVLLFFSCGRYTHPLIPWFAPVPFLYLLQRRMSQQITFLLYLSIFCSVIMALHSVCAPLGVPAVPLFLVGGIVTVLPFAVTGLFSEKVHGAVQTLVFPVTVVLLEILYTPHLSTSFSWSKTQSEYVYVIQICSIFGHYIVSFLLAWGASTAAFLIRVDPTRPQKMAALISCTLAGSVVLGFGIIRSNTDYRQSSVLTVAAITNEKCGLSRLKELQKRDSSNIRISLQNEKEQLFSQTEDAIELGAQLLLWQEHALFVELRNVDSVVHELCLLAKERGVDIVACLTTVALCDKQILRNQLIWCDSHGDVICRYDKQFPLPMEPRNATDNTVPIITTEKGRFASVICADADYPLYIQQVGKDSADLLLVPSLDWDEIAEYHLSMLPFRAVENGIPIIRSCGSGISAVIASNGKILYSKNHVFNPLLFVEDVNLVSQDTIYSRAGRIPIVLLLLGCTFLILWKCRFCSSIRSYVILISAVEFDGEL